MVLELLTNYSIMKSLRIAVSELAHLFVMLDTSVSQHFDIFFFCPVARVQHIFGD